MLIITEGSTAMVPYDLTTDIITFTTDPNDENREDTYLKEVKIANTSWDTKEELLLKIARAAIRNEPFLIL